MSVDIQRANLVQAEEFLSSIAQLGQLRELELWTDTNLIIRDVGLTKDLIFDSAKAVMENLHVEKVGCPFDQVTIFVEGFDGFVELSLPKIFSSKVNDSGHYEHSGCLKGERLLSFEVLRIPIDSAKVFKSINS
jgi:hypothetical protein